MTQHDSQKSSVRSDENASLKTRRLSSRLKSLSNENVAPVESEAATKGGAKARASLSAMDVEEQEDKRKSTCLKAANDALRKKSLEPAAAKYKRRRSSRSADENEALSVPQPQPQPQPLPHAITGRDEDNANAEAAPSLPPPAPSQPNSRDMPRRRSHSREKAAEAAIGEQADKENQAPQNGQEGLECDSSRSKSNGAAVESASQRSPAEAAASEDSTRTSSKNCGRVLRLDGEEESQPSAPEVKSHRIVRPHYMALRMKSADPAQCLDRIDDMYALYYAKEEKYSAKPYMHRQDDINRKMRAILVDWMVEVHFRFNLHTTTLWLSVNILDRYLMTARVMRAKLQLVGITAILIACKYEEMHPPEVRECVTITDEAYEKVELLEMEKHILVALDYDIMVPTTYTFLMRYLNAVNAAESTRHLASYYAERNLQEIDSLQYPPHHVAATAIYLANLQQQQSLHYFHGVTLEEWNPTLYIESGLLPEDLKGYARTMIKHVGEETETASKRRLTACKKKFALDRFASVSKLRLPSV